MFSFARRNDYAAYALKFYAPRDERERDEIESETHAWTHGKRARGEGRGGERERMREIMGRMYANEFPDMLQYFPLARSRNNITVSSAKYRSRRILAY